MPETDRSTVIPSNQVLPEHNPDCLGCGSNNEAGLHLEVVRIGDDFVAEVTFDRRQTGAPGLAHGGALAMACDDVLGFALYGVGAPAVTRSLEVQYHAPVVLGRPYRLAARLLRRDGRKLYLSAEGTAEDGTVAFSATALFIVVDYAHFERFGPVPGSGVLGAEVQAGRRARS